MLEWTDDDQDTASLEGWAIFDCDGSDNGTWQICVIEEPNLLGWLPFDEKLFEDDSDVWLHVVAKAKINSPLHIKALNWIGENNPMEYEAIHSWVRESTI